MRSASWRRWLASGLLLVLSATALAAEQRLLIAPHATDARLSVADASHLVIYEVGADDAPLLVWLGGTGGKPEVSQVCAGATLRAQPACARHLRQHRAWGEPQTSLVADRP